MPSHLILLFEQMPILLYLGAAVIGLLVGSFLNVVILRLPRIMEQEWLQECSELLAEQSSATVNTQKQPDRMLLGLSLPGSHCWSCGTAIKPWDNIPVLSWLLLRGRCRACKAKISPRYPLIELLTAALSLVVVWKFGPTGAALAALVLTWGLIALAVIDIDTQLLPDGLTQPLLWLGLLLSLGGTFTDPTSAILGTAGGYLLLWLLFHAFRLVTGKTGMGAGDFKLLALVGAWLGWQILPQVLLLSALSGILIGLLLIASGRTQARQPIPYGPFLAVAGWVNLIWGEAITHAYLRYWAALS
jgi:leader peptidase (prepilin peptidase)/N-methyltransferase